MQYKFKIKKYMYNEKNKIKNNFLGSTWIIREKIIYKRKASLLNWLQYSSMKK